MQRLIEQPGFCVKKFEENYLLKRLNPFAQNEEQRHITFSHLDCECGKAQNARDITAMKNQMSQFLEKWEDMMYQWQNDQPESYASDDYYEDDDLRQNTSASMEDDEAQPVPAQKPAEKQKPADVQKPVDIQKSVEVQKPAHAQKHEVEKQQHMPGSAVAEQCLWNVAHVSGQPAHSNNVAETPVENKNTSNTSSIKVPDVTVSSKAAEQGTVVDKVEKDTTKASKMEETPKPTSSESKKVPSTGPAETKKEGGSGSVKATDLQVVVPAKPDTMKDVVAVANIQKTTAEPEAARTNTASLLPDTLSQEEPISVATEETASLPSPLTQDGISPAITDNSRTAGSPDSGMISDISEFKSMELEKNESEAAKEKDPAKMTGRDGRRYRKKLEAEKLAAEQLMAEEKSEEVSTRASTESVGAESEEAVMSGKEKRRLKDKMRKEKKEQEKLEEAKKEKEAKEKEAAQQTTEKENSENSSPPEPSEAGLGDTTPNDDAPSISSPDNEAGPGLGAVDLAQEGTSEALSVDSNAPNMESYSEVAEEGAEEQPKKLSKSQKKRAYKKAKGVYVVNENKKGHSIELLPGEYKIVKLDQSPRKADASEGGDGQVAIPGVEGSPNQQNKKVNFYVAGNLSKDILDNGKWLAYVIDDKNADGTPRIGEVDTEEVEKTIRLLDSQLAHAEQTVAPYIDDFDYNALMSDKEAEQFVSQIVPELDADYVRQVLEKPAQAFAGAGESLCPIEAMLDDYLPDLTPDDLETYLTCDANDVVFKTEFARRTAPLFVGNNQFKEFCIKYSNSKFNPKTIHALIKKYIDARIVYHYEKFKKLADYEARHISARWTQVSENSPYALMVMLFINNKESSVNFTDIEKVLFPET